MPPEIAGGGEQLPTAGTRVVLRLVVVELVLVEIVLVAGLVTTAGDTATKHYFLPPLYMFSVAVFIESTEHLR